MSIWQCQRSAALAATLALIAAGLAGLPARTLAGFRIAIDRRAAALIVAAGGTFGLGARALAGVRTRVGRAAGMGRGIARARRMRTGGRRLAVGPTMFAALFSARCGPGCAITIRPARDIPNRPKRN